MFIPSDFLAHNYPIKSFVTGLDFYLRSAWKRDLCQEVSIEDTQYVFVSYLVIVVVCYFFYSEAYLTHADQQSNAKVGEIFRKLE